MRFEKKQAKSSYENKTVFKITKQLGDQNGIEFCKMDTCDLHNIVMLLQREFEAKQQLRQQMRRKK